jgi:hypothetical protein
MKELIEVLTPNARTGAPLVDLPDVAAVLVVAATTEAGEG